MGYHFAARDRLHDHHSNRRHVGSAYRRYRQSFRIFYATEIQNHNLVLGGVDHRLEGCFQLGQFAGIQLTEKHRELRVIAVGLQAIEDLIATFVVADVVTDEKMSTVHGGSSV